MTERAGGQPALVTAYAYGPATGLLQSVTRPNGTQTAYGYDTSGRLTDVLHRRTGGGALLLLRYRYTLDAAGRRTGVVVATPSGARAEAYGYDDLSRLVRAAYSDDNATVDATDRVVRYTYDGNGNRLTQTTYANGEAAGATEALAYAYGFENRLLTVTDQAGVVRERYAYDWRGNQVMKVTPTATTLYGYDARDLLMSVDDGANHVEYRYDGAGRRVGQVVNGVATRFVVDPSSAVYQTLEERDGAGNAQAAYVYGLERVAGIFPGQPTETYYLADGLGSVGALTDGGGADRGGLAYDAFGAVRGNPTGQPVTFGFAGERRDAVTALVYLRARTYDPTKGRFLQKDPMGFVDGPSMYVYAGGDPLNRADPLGTDSIFDVGLDWFTENGAANRTYGPDSSVTRDLIKDEGVAQAREAYQTFLQTNKLGPRGSIVNGAYRYSYNFGVGEYLREASEGDMTGFFLGSYNVDITRGPNGTINYKIPNTYGWSSATRSPIDGTRSNSSVEGMLLHGQPLTLFPKSVLDDRSRAEFGPGGNMTQNYQWSERTTTRATRPAPG